MLSPDVCKSKIILDTLKYIYIYIYMEVNSENKPDNIEDKLKNKIIRREEFNVIERRRNNVSVLINLLQG